MARTTKSRRRRGGFTLMEMMVVILLLGIVVSMAGYSYFDTLQQQQRAVAHTQAMSLANDVETYRLLHGRLPAPQDGLEALVTQPGRPGVLRKLPRDPWEERYLYVAPGRHNPTFVDIQSKGPNRKADDQDDVGNWDLEDG